MSAAEVSRRGGGWKPTQLPTAACCCCCCAAPVLARQWLAVPRPSPRAGISEEGLPCGTASDTGSTATAAAAAPPSDRHKPATSLAWMPASTPPLPSAPPPPPPPSPPPPSSFPVNEASALQSAESGTMSDMGVAPPPLL